jgi:hypothetical protein
LGSNNTTSYGKPRNFEQTSPDEPSGPFDRWERRLTSLRIHYLSGTDTRVGRNDADGWARVPKAYASWRSARSAATKAPLGFERCHCPPARGLRTHSLSHARRPIRSSALRRSTCGRGRRLFSRRRCRKTGAPEPRLLRQWRVRASALRRRERGERRRNE